jgi:uncharacterized protein (DUF427 family)
VQPTDRRIEVDFSGTTIADSTRSLRVLETSHPPVYYIPLEDIAEGVLVSSGHASYCEFKGEACYFHVTSGGRTAEDAAWTYDSPAPGYEALKGHAAFYPQAMDECRVDGEIARPQPGRFYGGWVTADVVGPFKGDPGTNGW